MQLTTIGLDLAKQVFQVHGVDIAGNIVLKRRLRRGQMIAFFRRADALPGRNGGLRHGPLLGTRADGTWS